MPTATKSAARSLPAHGEPHRILSMDDLHDPKRFKTIRGVPILDRHSDPVKGTIDDEKLDLLAKNSNALNAQGDHPTLTIGHSRRKATVIVIRNDGSKVVLPGASEEEQPPIVGHLSNWHVVPFRGIPTLHADYHIANEHLERVKAYPHRSAERLEPPDDGNDEGEDKTRHYIDRVSLLSTAPERQLGVTHYEQGDICVDGSCPTRPLIRTCYDRDLPPIAYESDRDSSASDSAAAGADCPCGHTDPSTAPTTTQYAKDSVMPEAPPAQAAAPPPPAAVAEDAPAAATTIGNMTFDDFMGMFGSAIQPMIHDGVMNSLMTLMPPEGDEESSDEPSGDNDGDGIRNDADATPDGEPPPEVAQYEADDGVDPEVQTAAAGAAPAPMADMAAQDVGKERVKYASEPGAGNVFTPGGTGPAKKAGACNGSVMPKETKMEKTLYQKEVGDLKTALAAFDAERINYQKELDETREVILMLVEDRNNAQLYAKRNAFKEELQPLIADGYVVDVDDELAAVTLETPPEYNEARIGKIRRLHARSAANVRHTIPIGGVTPTSGKSAGIATADQAYEAANFAITNGCSIPEAKRQLGYG